MPEFQVENTQFLAVMEAAREAAVQQVTDMARNTHEAATGAGNDASVGTYLAAEGRKLVRLYERREGFLDHFSQMSRWQRRRLGWTPPDEASVEWRTQHVRSKELKQRSEYSYQMWNLWAYRSGVLLGVEGPITDEGGIAQSYSLECQPAPDFIPEAYPTIRTFISTHSPQLDKPMTQKLHTVTAYESRVWVKKAGKKADDSEKFFILGLIQLAQDEVKQSVPPKIAEQW